MVHGQHAVLKVLHPQSWPRDPCNPSVTVHDAPCREPVHDHHGNTEAGHDHLQGDFRASDPSQRDVKGSERVGRAQEDHVSGPVPPLTDCVPGLPSPLLYTGIDLGKYTEFSDSKDVYHYNPGLFSRH